MKYQQCNWHILNEEDKGFQQGINQDLDVSFLRLEPTYQPLNALTVHAGCFLDDVSEIAR